MSQSRTATLERIGVMLALANTADETSEYIRRQRQAADLQNTLGEVTDRELCYIESVCSKRIETYEAEARS